MPERITGIIVPWVYFPPFGILFHEGRAHLSVAPLAVPRALCSAWHSAGPHFGWIGGGWRYTIGALKLFSPASLLCS